MRIISWNVNSINKRLTQIEGLYKQFKPDIICIQETRGTINIDEIKGKFIECEIFVGQSIKGRNGVLTLVNRDLFKDLKIIKYSSNLSTDRYLELAINNNKINPLHLINVYVPNGGSEGAIDALNTDKFFIKIKFLKELIIRVYRLRFFNVNVIVCGDINIVPRDIDGWYYWSNISTKGIVCFSDQERKLFKILSYLLPASSENNTHYTWYSYQNEFIGNYSKGLKIDFILANNKFIVKDYEVIRSWRFNKEFSSRSDHAPILTEYIFKN